MRENAGKMWTRITPNMDTFYAVVIICDEIIKAADCVSTHVLTNVTSTVSINFHNKKASDIIDCYIPHTVLLMVILLFIAAIICYHYAPRRTKRKKIGTPTI